MTIRAIVARVRLLLPGLGCLALALLMLGAGSSTHELTCERSAGTCTSRAGSLWTARERSFRITDVREVRFIEGLGKHERDAETALVFASGDEWQLARGDREAARTRFVELRDFFATGSGVPRIHLLAHGSRWLYVAALGLAIAAAVLGVKGWRASPVIRGATVLRPGDAEVARRSWRIARVALGGAVVVIVLQLVLWRIAVRTQGTLELACQTRCRFQGGECLPGGEVQMTLDPGAYTIEVWNGAGAERWTAKPFTIEVGETTRFVCAP